MIAFLAPLFLIGAAAAAVPLALHLFQRHTEHRVVFPAVALLKGAPVEHTRRRRLRDLLLLALRVGALVVLALAFARPYFRSAAGTHARLTVVALDTSLSMSAPAVFARARQMAGDAVRQAVAGDEVAVVTFADRAEVVVPPGADRSAATAALAAVRPGFGSTSYAAAFTTAGELLRGRAGAIAIITDLQASGWDAGGQLSLPESIRVDVKDAGVAPGNLSVDAVRQDRDRVIASIRNSGARARDVRARLTVDGRASGQATIRVEPQSAADAVFTNVRASGAAAVSIDDPDGIPNDDTRYAVIGGDSAGSALVVTTSGDLEKDAWYVRHALSGARGVAASDLGTWKADALNTFGAVVLLSTRGLGRPGREKLAAFAAAGGGLLIAAGPDVDGDVVADVLGPGARLNIGEMATPQPLMLAPADVRHPIFRAFGDDVSALGLARFRNVARVSGRSCQTIAQFTSGDPAMLDCTAAGGRAIVVASDLDDRWNDLPVHASFVPFVDQAVRYLAANSRRGTEYVVSEAPAGVKPVPGVTNVGGRRVVVNVDPNESAVQRMTPAEFQASVARLRTAAAQDARLDVAAQESRQHVWQYLLIAMLVALVVESVLAARTA